MTVKIERIETTWDPITRCSKTLEVTCDEDVLDEPFHWKKPRLCCVNSMVDLFHNDVSDILIHTVFDVMSMFPKHTFQVLTKHESRLAQLAPSLMLDEHIWMGVTVESASHVHRIDNLRNMQALIKFISFEPLLGPIPNIDLYDIDWVIVGGESGPRSRPLEKEWVRDIRDQCIAARVPFFFKHWVEGTKKLNGTLLVGHEWMEMPRKAAYN